MFDWANGAPPAELAAEIMAAFGPDGAQGRLDSLDARGVAIWLFRGYPGGHRYATQLENPIREALQLLDHAELVMVSSSSNQGGPSWRATRLGLATLASGKAAVRQRIKDRTGL
jgi:hypothetical protein